MDERFATMARAEALIRCDTPSRRHVVAGLGALALGSFGVFSAPSASFAALRPAGAAAPRSRTHHGRHHHDKHHRHGHS